LTNAQAVSVGEVRPVLGGPQGFPVDLAWLRRGLATFLWSSSRSLASLHHRAAAGIAHLHRASQATTDGIRIQLAGSFVQYLFERHGIQRLRRFFRRAERVGIDAGARSAFGRGFFELESDWEDMLDSIER
jgi:hypothetical protein